MSGNASFRPVNTTVLSVCAVDAPVVMTSAAFDERLADTYRRVGTRPGMLEKLAGVIERRWWPTDVSFADAAALAGSKALAEAGITPAQVGVLINTAVSREYTIRWAYLRAASTSTWRMPVSVLSTVSSWLGR